MDYLERFVAGANAIIWSDVLIFLLMAVGIYFSVRMRFFQVRLIKDMVQLMVGGKKSKEGISPFQALPRPKLSHGFSVPRSLRF